MLKAGPGPGRGQRETTIPGELPAREWIISPRHADGARLAAEAGLAPLVAQVLLNRGVNTAREALRFLSPDFKELLPPENLPNAVDAARRLARAVRGGRRVVVYGDYDVDGITATAILWHALTLAGGRVSFYIPSRLEEGYGLNADALRQIAGEGGELVITVDCGITASEEARLARQLGLELIVTDHHEPRGGLPDADCVVHPTACGESSDNRDLCGAGVALKIAWAFALEFCGGSCVTPRFKEFLREATGLAALGLVADVVPLTGENRLLASFGLRQLCRTCNPGLRALIEVSGLSGKSAYDDYDVGFRLAPRLNAVGRLGHARLAVELFTRADATRAREIAVMLDAQNRRRQEVERGILKQAEALIIERGLDRESCQGIVLASSQWHPGVVGIVATRLVERFGRPTILIALNDGQGQGSGRSVRHFPLHEVLQACGAHLQSYGGHAMAAGVKLSAEQVEPFARAFQAEAARRLTCSDLRARLFLDDEVALAELTTEVVQTLLRMAPHGPGNPAPRLATHAVDLVDSPRPVGRLGQHLQLTVRQDRHYRRAIAFGFGSQIDDLSQHRAVRLAFEPIINEWNGKRNVELRVIDWKPA